MGKKSGTAGSADSPTAPDETKDADDAKTGEVPATEGKGASKGPAKVGSATVGGAGGDKGGGSPEDNTHRVGIELVDDQGKAVANEEYKVIDADGNEHSGQLDSKGKGEVRGLPPGNCKITFPKIAGQEWK